MGLLAEQPLQTAHIQPEPDIYYFLAFPNNRNTVAEIKQKIKHKKSRRTERKNMSGDDQHHGMEMLVVNWLLLSTHSIQYTLCKSRTIFFSSLTELL